MKKILLLIVFIFILCILIQYNYLVEKFDGNSNLLMVTRPIEVPRLVQLLFTKEYEDLRDVAGSIYLKLLNSEYSSLVSQVNNYKNNAINHILTKFESYINKQVIPDRFGGSAKNVYIIGSSSNETTPTSTNMSNIFYNIAGEYLKYIDNVLYVYSGLIQKENIADIDEDGLTLYLEGWVREDLRTFTHSQPNIETIQNYAEWYSNSNALCLHTDDNSKIYNLDHLMEHKDTGKKGKWKVTYNGEKLNDSPNWKNGMRNGLRGELGTRISSTKSKENGGIKPIFDVDFYCNDKSKIKVTAVPEIDINKVDLYFGLHESELSRGERPLADPLPLYNPSVKSFKTIDLTVEVEMTDECALSARKSIKRLNGNTLELYKDKRKKGCELEELRESIYTNLVELKEVIITTPYVPHLDLNPVPIPVSNPILDMTPVQPEVTTMSARRDFSVQIADEHKLNLKKYVKKYGKKFTNNRFKFH